MQSPSADYRELLIGCGNRRAKEIHIVAQQVWNNLTTLDIDPNAGADVEWDLERLPLPFADETFDEIHAYEVLEHTGGQGDWRFFFAQFSDFWRMLKPGGFLVGSVPAPECRWVWGDPGHRRSLSEDAFGFLSQPVYTAEVGVTTRCDYRRWYRADFDQFAVPNMPEFRYGFMLKAVKPSRISV